MNTDHGGDKMAAWTRVAMVKKKKWGCIRFYKNLEAEPMGLALGWDAGTRGWCQISGLDM